jgi:4'-phosphopantetheinyl transferase EntD
MISDLLPPNIVGIDAFADLWEPRLFPAEQQAIRQANEKRRREFSTVRVCARKALAQLGVAPAPILPGDAGAPTWPAGIVGSMTHCEGYRAAAVAHGREVKSLGIDAEPNQPLPDEVVDLISSPEEREHLRELQWSWPEVSWDRALFCAKESVYKARFPLRRRWLDFTDVQITFQILLGTFKAQDRDPGASLTWMSGRWRVGSGLIVTSLIIPQDGSLIV